MKNFRIIAGAALACAAAVSLSACGLAGVGGVPGASAANANQVLGSFADTVKAINSSCTGSFTGNLTFAPPLPPVGSVSISQNCGIKNSAGGPDPAPTPAQLQAMVDAAVAKATSPAALVADHK